jgi:hypothetical protein
MATWFKVSCFPTRSEGLERVKRDTLKFKVGAKKSKESILRHLAATGLPFSGLFSLRKFLAPGLH